MSERFHKNSFFLPKSLVTCHDVPVANKLIISIDLVIVDKCAGLDWLNWSTMAESEGDNSIPPPPLSGRTVNSFAYKTIKDRLPVILTKGGRAHTHQSLCAVMRILGSWVAMLSCGRRGPSSVRPKVGRPKSNRSRRLQWLFPKPNPKFAEVRNRSSKLLQFFDWIKFF